MFFTKLTLRNNRLGKKLKSPPPPPPLQIEDTNITSKAIERIQQQYNKSRNNTVNNKKQDNINNASGLFNNQHTPQQSIPSRHPLTSSSITKPSASLSSPSLSFKSFLSRSMSFLRISTHRTSATIVSEDCKKSPIKEKQPPNKEIQLRVSAFLKLLDSHSEFFKGCPEIDTYIIAMAFVHLQRVQPPLTPEQYTSELFFYSLYLAWETEEDSTVGVEGIIHYIIGPFPSGRNKDKITRKYEIVEWKRKLQVFHVGKDKLWKALDYRTIVDRPTTLKALSLFPQDQIKFVHPRVPKDLAKFFS